eukprot:Sspe_Gene.3389::Locus_1111_Transcript_1_3_Confidence_0.500_Length_1698::g.3389::m.3389/K09500/CCT8; T-complex protein 1 subunit theta
MTESNSYKALGRDGNLLAGAGAVDTELQKDLLKYADETPGVDQYSIRSFANSFETVPRILAEVAGHNANELLPELMAAHSAGNAKAGIEIDEGKVKDTGVVDLYLTKFWGIQLAADAAMNVLKVDQIIMAKPAGGPKMRPQGGRDED